MEEDQQSGISTSGVVVDLRNALHKEFHDVLAVQDYRLALDIAETLVRVIELEDGLTRLAAPRR